MRLLTRQFEGDTDAITALYGKAKQCYAYLESSGLTSFRVLQGLLLISYYEVANAIYPAAYLTVGTCARLGHALGLHNRRLASQMHPQTGKPLTNYRCLDLIPWQVLGKSSKRSEGLGGVSSFWIGKLNPKFNMRKSPDLQCQLEDTSTLE